MNLTRYYTEVMMQQPPPVLPPDTPPGIMTWEDLQTYQQLEWEATRDALKVRDEEWEQTRENPRT